MSRKNNPGPLAEGWVYGGRMAVWERVACYVMVILTFVILGRIAMYLVGL